MRLSAFFPVFSRCPSVRIPFGGLAFAALLVLGGTTQAQTTVELKTGGTVGGDVTAMSSTEVTVDPGVGDPKTVKVNEIERILWDRESLQVKNGRKFEGERKYEEAIAAYREELGDAGENLKIELEFLIARSLAKQSRNDAAKSDEAIAALEKFGTDHAEFYRYYDSLRWLGQVLTRKGDQQAVQVYSKLAESPFKNDQMEAKVSQARFKLKQGQTDAALSDFRQVSSMNAENDLQKAQIVQALLGEALALTEKGDHDNALKVIDRVTTEADSGATDLQAEAYLTKGKSLMAAEEPKAALMAYLHVDTLFFQNPDHHAEALYHLANLWRTVGKGDRAQSSASRLKQSYPDSEWANKLN